jgi:hypothetical protein
MGELRETRLRNNELESRVEPVMSELRLVREQLTALLDTASPEGVDVEAAIATATARVTALHLARVAELERDLAKADAEAMKVREELARTLREKSFIEDEYLQMTEAEEAMKS